MGGEYRYSLGIFRSIKYQKKTNLPEGAFYSLIDVNINLVVMVVGVIVVLLAVYVVRLTLWVFKESM